VNRARSSLGVLLGALVGLPACDGLAERESLPPRGQILLAITTDAWLPRGPDDPREPFETTPLFERLRVEFFAPGEAEPCRDCERDFALDTRTVNEGRASVGFVPKPGVSGYRARVRIYHSGPSESYAEPRLRSTIETVVALPSIAAEGLVPLHVVLRTDDLGRPRGSLEAPVTTEIGAPPKGLAGSWNVAVRRGCPEPAREAREGEACVPGGAFWMGDPTLIRPFERLVVVSPFYIDTHEVAVADLRASGVAQSGENDPVAKGPDPAARSHQCTWTAVPGANEELPVNCIGRALAQAYCTKRGRRLPSEVEIEFVAGARRDATFPWGEQMATCADAIYGRAWDTSTPPEFRACLVGSISAGVAKPGSGRLDRVRLPDGSEVLDLAGNLAEWVLDEYSTDEEPCLVENPAVDPVCHTPSRVEPGRSLVRGTSWALPGASLLRAAERSSFEARQDEEVGFRCARDAR
jgi:formylglycine-generating enzyme